MFQPRRIITGLFVSLASAGLLLGASITPAAADTWIVGLGLGGTYNIGAAHGGQTVNWWAGGYSTTKGIGFCLQPHRDWSGSSALSEPKQLTSFTNDQGKALTKAQLNQLAYLMWRATTAVTSNKTAVMYRMVMLTIAGYDHVQVNRGGSKLSTTYYNFSLDDPKSDATRIVNSFGVLSQAVALLAETRAKANNWDGTATASISDAPAHLGDDLVATVKLPGLGTGTEVVFKVTSPGGDSQSVTVATIDDVAELAYAMTAFGHYEVTAALASPVAPRYPMIATSSSYQSLLMVSGKARTWASAIMTRDFDMPQPAIGTQISSSLILPGETISDAVELTGLIDDDSVVYVVDGGLFGLPVGDDGQCPGADSPDWATTEQLLAIEGVPVDDITDDGTASLQLGQWTVPATAGGLCVSYGESVTMTVDGEVAAVVDHPAGDPGQTGLVLGLPTIDTQISGAEFGAGETVSDTATVGGIDGAHASYQIDGRLVAVPVPASGLCPGIGDAAWADGQTLATISETIELGWDDADWSAPGLGAWTVPSSPVGLCVTYAETVTMQVDGHSPVVVDHPAGHPQQTAKTVPVVPTILFDTGGSVVGPAPLAGLLGLGLLALAVRLFVRTARR